MLQKALPLILIVFVIFYVATDPEGAADVTRAIGEAIGDFFGALGRFLDNLVNG